MLGALASRPLSPATQKRAPASSWKDTVALSVQNTKNIVYVGLLQLGTVTMVSCRYLVFEYLDR